MGKIIGGVIGLLFAFILPYPLQIIRAPLALVGLALIVWGIIARSKSSTNTSTAEGFGSGFTYAFESNKTGIALSTDRKIVKLKDLKLTKEYPFSDIREWKTNIASGGEIFFAGGSFSAGMAALGENRRNRKRNIADSGFFITVRDIDNPVWRIEMLDEKSQQRWMEIMRQCINEA